MRQRQAFLPRVMGAVAMAVSSWLLADRLTAHAFSHAHAPAAGGPPVAHLHASSVLLAAGGVLLACLAAVLVIALAAERGWRERGHAGCPSADGPRGVPDPDPTVGRSAWSAAAGTGALLGSVVVVEEVVRPLSGQGGLPHPIALLTTALAQAAIAGAGQLIWYWCVAAVWRWGRRHLPAGSTLPPRGKAAASGGVAALIGSTAHAHRGRGPPAHGRPRRAPVPSLILT